MPLLIGDSWTGTAPRPQILDCLFPLLCLYVFAAVVLLWYLAWYE